MGMPGASAYKGQKKSPCALELELQVDVSRCVGAESWTWILWKSSRALNSETSLGSQIASI